jgi:hypothetical protein
VADGLGNAFEVFSAPVEQLIAALGRGISEAQAALDQNSIAAQEAIDASPALSQLGLQATWYQMPKVDLQLKIALSVVSEGAGLPPTPLGPLAVPATLRGLRLVAQPVSAAFQNHFNYDTQASSQINLTVVPVPAPAGGDQVTVPPIMTPEAVRAAAFGSPASFTTATDPQGATVPAANLRFDMNFNAANRTWYVVQSNPADPAAPVIAVAVDDRTGNVRVLG